METSTKSESKIDIKSETETAAESQVDAEAQSGSDESLSSLMEQYSKFGKDQPSLSPSNHQNSQISEDEAMYAFSQAKLNGIKIMDLPDAPKPQEFNDEQSTLIFQANEIEKQNNGEQQSTEKPKPQEQSQNDQQETSILQLASQYALESHEQLKPKEQQQLPPSEIQINSQKAIDEVQIVIPDGMQVQSHFKSENPQEEEQLQNLHQNENKNNDARKKDELGDLTDVQQQAQAALEHITVQDPFKEQKSKKEKKQKPKIMDHIFDQTPEQVQPEVIKQEQIFQPVFAEAPVVQKEEKNLEVEQIIQKAQAASQQVQVKQINDIPIANTQQQIQKESVPEPIQPKYLKSQQQQKQKETEIDISIRNAELAQGEKEDLPENQEKLEKQISGSDGMWDSQIEMEHITGKLTRPQDFKPKEQIEREKKIKEKLMKQKIREELLAPEPVTDFDQKLYSGYLASKSLKSKSEVEIQEDKQRKIKERQEKEEAAKKKLRMIQEQNEKYQNQLKAEEDAQIRQAQMQRIQKKNEQDMKNIDDFKALEKLQRGITNNQVQGLTEQVQEEENQRQENDQIMMAQQDFKQKIQENQSNNQDDLQQKLGEYSKKLGVPIMAGDDKIQSSQDVAKVMVQRAVQAGKSEAQITKALGK